MRVKFITVFVVSGTMFFAHWWFDLYLGAIGFACSSAGIICNALVMSLNGWKMPVVTSDPEMMWELRLEAPESPHRLAGPDTRLIFLADCIWIGYGKASIGDVLMFLGTGLVVLQPVLSW